MVCSCSRILGTQPSHIPIVCRRNFEPESLDFEWKHPPSVRNPIVDVFARDKTHSAHILSQSHSSSHRVFETMSFEFKGKNFNAVLQHNTKLVSPNYRYNFHSFSIKSAYITSVNIFREELRSYQEGGKLVVDTPDDDARLCHYMGQAGLRIVSCTSQIPLFAFCRLFGGFWWPKNSGIKRRCFQLWKTGREARNVRVFGGYLDRRRHRSSNSFSCSETNNIHKPGLFQVFQLQPAHTYLSKTELQAHRFDNVELMVCIREQVCVCVCVCVCACLIRRWHMQSVDVPHLHAVVRLQDLNHPPRSCGLMEFCDLV